MESVWATAIFDIIRSYIFILIKQKTQKSFYGWNDFSQKVFPYLCDNTVNGTPYHKNTKRFTTKIPNDLPQKHQTKCHKNTK